MNTPCACDPESNVKCMLHTNLDAAILTDALNEADETNEEILRRRETEADKAAWYDLDR